MFSFFNSPLVLRGTAFFALFWVITRASVQSITMDEAVSYSNFSGMRGWHWDAHANNHILNSLLMHLFTSTFGTYHLTVWAGAVIGAAIYIYGAFRLAALEHVSAGLNRGIPLKL